MESMIHIGNLFDKKATANIVDGISKIFSSGYKYRAEQETIRAAVDAFIRTAEVKNTTITGCSLTNRADK